MGTHRSPLLKKLVIGISVSNAEDLLARGLGKDHLREILFALCRPMLRHGADLAYGGHFKKDSLTQQLIELISAEQEAGNADQRPWIGWLYNHNPWPYYFDITRADEAAWIDCCRFVRVTQEMAGLDPAQGEVLPGYTEGVTSLRIAFNRAVVLTAMRRLMVEGHELDLPGGRRRVRVHARVILGGATTKFTGIMPGVVEEALFALEGRGGSPLYVLGGFGGAAARLADYLAGKPCPPELTMPFFREKVDGYRRLEEAFSELHRPGVGRKPEEALGALCRLIETGRGDLEKLLQNGLDHADNLRLLTTSNGDEAVALVLQGLRAIAPELHQAAAS